MIKICNPHYKHTKEWEKRAREILGVWNFLSNGCDPKDTSHFKIINSYYFFSIIKNCMIYFNGQIKKLN